MKRKPTETRYGKTLNQVMTMTSISPLIIWAPQIMKIHQTQENDGIAMSSLALYFAISAVWFLYGIQKEDKPLILSGCSGCLSSILVVASMMAV